MPAKLTIRGIQEAQRANEDVIRSLKPGGGLESAVNYALTAAHRYAVSITHVWRYKGGALRASHRMDKDAPLRGRIYIDPGSVNPRGQKPAVYGVYEHNRGGSHAFYERTQNEAGRGIAQAAAAGYVRGLP